MLIAFDKSATASVTTSTKIILQAMCVKKLVGFILTSETLRCFRSATPSESRLKNATDGTAFPGRNGRSAGSWRVVGPAASQVLLRSRCAQVREASYFRSSPSRSEGRGMGGEVVRAFGELPLRGFREDRRVATARRRQIKFRSAHVVRVIAMRRAFGDGKLRSVGARVRVIFGLHIRCAADDRADAAG